MVPKLNVTPVALKKNSPVYKMPAMQEGGPKLSSQEDMKTATHGSTCLSSQRWGGRARRVPWGSLAKEYSYSGESQVPEKEVQSQE